MNECWGCDRSGFATVKALEDHSEAFHTHEEVHQLLRDSLMKMNMEMFLRDVANDWFVAMDYSQVPPTLMKASYKVSDDGEVKVGKFVPVRAKTTYLPLPEDSDSSALHAYKCTKKNCKKRFESKSKLRKHMQDDHSSLADLYEEI